MTANCLTQSSVKYFIKRAEKLSCESGFGVESGANLNQNLVENFGYTQVDIIAALNKQRYFELFSLKNKKNNLVLSNTKNLDSVYLCSETLKHKNGLQSILPFNTTIWAYLKCNQVKDGFTY